MKKMIHFAFVALLLSGCAAATQNRYGDIYNRAINHGHNVAIIKTNDIEYVKANTEIHLASVGYEKVAYSRPDQGFMVMVKRIPVAQAAFMGDPHPYRLIIKYTPAGEGKTRVDLVNGSPSAFTKGVVDKDIQTIADLIRIGL